MFFEFVDKENGNINKPGATKQETECKPLPKFIIQEMGAANLDGCQKLLAFQTRLQSEEFCKPDGKTDKEGKEALLTTVKQLRSEWNCKYKEEKSNVKKTRADETTGKQGCESIPWIARIVCHTSVAATTGDRK